ncbi:hypothetical protein F4819DRAFT_505960 [Hypoxylon fuscum]|nr:hypothetical protein F4819DRAFT_505960 [Hypoxylon fuscum]
MSTNISETSDLESLFGGPAESIASTAQDIAALVRDNERYGLEWVRDGNSSSEMPKWTVEPTIYSIVLTLQKVIGPQNQYVVEHHWDGVLGKIYFVSYEQNHFVMRLSLPVCPNIKTESEVATLRWIYKNTNLPVPRVHHYDSSRTNPIGFEWILMDRLEGTPLSQCWHDITQDAKERIVKQVAAYAVVAFEKQFRGIGNIYPSELNDPESPPRVGEMVSMTLF